MNSLSVSQELKKRGRHWSKRPFFFNEADWHVAKELWRWKVLTTAAISRLCYPHLEYRSAYLRLWRMERGGMIRATSPGDPRICLWTITDKAFELLLQSLPELKDEGYKSENLIHDLVVSAIHFGNEIDHHTPGVSTCTEQELRRFHPEHLPEWVPKTQYHRPDGYWQAEGRIGMFTMALEVERSRKANYKYWSVADFYARESTIKRVVWLVPNKHRCRSLHRQIAKELKGKPMIHNFLDYPTFLKLGWGAPFVCGPEEGKSLGYLLGIKAGYSDNYVCTNSLLDVRKSPHVTPRCKLLSKTEFRN